MSSVRIVSACLRLELGGQLLEPETVQVPRRARGKADRSDSVLRSKGREEVAERCCNTDKNSGCCEYKSGLRTTASIRVSDG